MPAEAPRTRRPLVVASVMLATFMVAIEATIVATAMPHIVGQLGGFNYYSWVFAAFLLAQTTTTVIYGKLSDIFGRKPVLIGGIVLFLAASILCGFAWSMPALIVFRLLQGIGAGAIQPVTMTVIGDLYTLEQRGKVQGFIASVWATSAVIGPLTGGLIVDNLSWAWIFWINIPVGILAIIGFASFLHETIEKKAVQIDYLGAALFSVAIISLLVILTEIEAPLSTLAIFGAICLVSGVLFFRQERRAPEPIISLALWSRRLIATSNTSTLLAGMALIGLTTILPLYVQGVLGRSPTVAGFTLTMLVLGWPLSVVLSPRLYRLFGIRNTLRAGSAMFPLGAAFLLLLTPDTHPAVAGVGSFLMGVGMGLMSLTSIVLIQESVEWSARGSATASIIFARSLGNTLGATVLGAVLNIGIARLATGEEASRLHDVLEHPAGLAEVANNPAVRAVFDQALHLTYWGVLVLALLAFGATWLIPVRERPRATAVTPASEAASAASH